MKRLAHEFSDSPLTIISVTDQYDYLWDEDTKTPVKSDQPVELSDQLESLKEFNHSYDNPFPMLITEKGSDFATQLGATKIPHLVVADQNGIIRLLLTGHSEANNQILRRAVFRLLDNATVENANGSNR